MWHSVFNNCSQILTTGFCMMTKIEPYLNYTSLKLFFLFFYFFWGQMMISHNFLNLYLVSYITKFIVFIHEFYYHLINDTRLNYKFNTMKWTCVKSCFFQKVSHHIFHLSLVFIKPIDSLSKTGFKFKGFKT